jgi:uncharacterized protein (TIGR03067 family)
MTPVLLTLTLTLAAPGPKDKPPASIEGDWVVETHVVGGVESKQFIGEVVSFGGGRMVFDQGREAFNYSLDRTATPFGIDQTDPKDKDYLIPGIFKIDGDVLTMCFPKGGHGERPTTFESPGGTLVILMTLKRAPR